jgi:hypothetical protein
MTASSPPAVDELTAASTPEQRSPGQFLWSVPDGWQQGRGAFGGLVLAAMTRAIEASEPEADRLVRSVGAEIAGPVLAGEATIEVRAVRRGSGLSCWNATLLQGGQGLVRASAVLARSRNTDPPRLDMAPPSPPPWTEVAHVPLDSAFGAPVFSRHLEFRVLGALPFSGATEAVASGWIRPKRTPPSLGAPEVVALADAWWPASLTTSTTPRPMATVSFALQHIPPRSPLDPSIPLFYRARVVSEQDGFMVELRELWSADGRLVALNQQTIAWIR